MLAGITWSYVQDWVQTAPTTTPTPTFGTSGATHTYGNTEKGVLVLTIDGSIVDNPATPANEANGDDVYLRVSAGNYIFASDPSFANTIVSIPAGYATGYSVQTRDPDTTVTPSTGAVFTGYTASFDTIYVRTANLADGKDKPSFTIVGASQDVAKSLVVDLTASGGALSGSTIQIGAPVIVAADAAGGAIGYQGAAATSPEKVGGAIYMAAESIAMNAVVSSRNNLTLASAIGADNQAKGITPEGVVIRNAVTGFDTIDIDVDGTGFLLAAGGRISGDSSLTVPPSTVMLNATVRDFTPQTNPDFESAAAITAMTTYGTGIPNLVKQNIGANGKPVFDDPRSTKSIQSAQTFSQWYTDIPGTNITFTIPIQLNRDPVSGIYSYSNNSYFPIDGKGFGNYASTGRNYHFTTEISTTFKYSGGEVFSFAGDDDLWVFFNGYRAIDLGGLAGGGVSQTVSLDSIAAAAGMTKGGTYSFQMFNAERHTTASNLNINTTIDFSPQIVYANTGSIYLRTRDADAVVEGKIYATDQFYDLEASANAGGARHSLTTVSPTTGANTGKLIGANAYVHLADQSGGTVNLQSSFDLLRITSAASTPANALDYDVTIANDKSLLLDAVSASKGDIALSTTSGTITLVAVIDTPGGLSLTSADDLAVSSAIKSGRSISLESTVGSVTTTADVETAATATNEGAITITAAKNVTIDSRVEASAEGVYVTAGGTISTTTAITTPSSTRLNWSTRTRNNNDEQVTLQDGTVVQITRTQADSEQVTFPSFYHYSSLVYPEKNPDGEAGTTSWPGPRTWTFSQPVTNPVLALYSVGNTDRMETVTLSSSAPFTLLPVTVSADNPLRLISPTSFSGTEGYGIVQFQGTFTSITLTPDSPETYTNYAWGLPDQPSSQAVNGLIVGPSTKLTAAAGIDVSTSVDNLVADVSAGGGISVTDLRTGTGALIVTSASTAEGSVLITSARSISAAKMIAGGSGDISLNTTGGDIDVGSVIADGDAVTLVATDFAADGTTVLHQGVITGNAPVAAEISWTAARVEDAMGNESAELYRGIPTISAYRLSSGDIAFTTDGAVTLKAIKTTDGGVNVTALGGDLTATSIVAVSMGAAADISLESKAGGVTLGTVQTTTGEVIVTSAQGIGSAIATVAPTPSPAPTTRPNTFMLQSHQAGSTTDIDNLQITNLDTSKVTYVNTFSAPEDATRDLNLWYWPQGGHSTANYELNGSTKTRIVNGELRLETTGFGSNGSGGYDSHTEAEYLGTLPQNFLIEFDAQRQVWEGRFLFWLWHRDPSDPAGPYLAGGAFTPTRSSSLPNDIANMQGEGSWFSQWAGVVRDVNGPYPGGTDGGFIGKWPSVPGDMLNSTRRIGFELKGDTTTWYLDGKTVGSIANPEWAITTPSPTTPSTGTASPNITANRVTLRASTAGGSADIGTAENSIVLSSPVAGGTVDLTVESASTIAYPRAAAAANAFISSTSALSLNAAAGSSIDVKSTGATADIDVQSVTVAAADGTVTLTSGRDLTLGSVQVGGGAFADGSKISLTAAGVIRNADATDPTATVLEADALSLSAASLDGSFDVTNVDLVNRLSAAATAAGAGVTLVFDRANPLTLDGITTASGNVAISNVDAGDILIGSKGITAGTKTSANTVTIVSVGEIGEPVDPAESQGTITAGGQVTLTAAGDIKASTSAGQLAATSGGTLDISQSGDVKFAGITAATSATLDVAGAVLAGAGTLTAPLATVKATGGIDLKTDVTTLSAVSSGSNVTILETNGLEVGADGIKASGTASITLTAGNLDSSGGVISGSAVGIKLLAKGDLDVDTSASSLTASTASGNITIRNDKSFNIGSAGIVVGDPTKNDITLSVASGGITTGTGSLKADVLTLSATTGIVANTSANSLTATSTAGDIAITQTGKAVTLTAITASNGGVTVTNNDDVTVTSVQAIGSGKNVSITATGTGKKITLASGGIVADGDPVALSASGAIDGNDNTTIPDVKAATATLIAGGGNLKSTLQATAVTAKASGDLDVRLLGTKTVFLVPSGGTVLSAAGNVTLRTGTNDVVVVTAPTVGTGKTTTYETTGLVTFAVTATAATGAGSLAKAVADASAATIIGGSAGVSFASTVTSPIQLTNTLDISKRLTIDGTRRINVATGALVTGPMVNIDGSKLGSASTSGVKFTTSGASTSSNSSLRGLAFYGFSRGAAVEIAPTADSATIDGITVQGNLFGISTAGLASGNKIGILAQNTTVGATKAVTGLTILGNTIVRSSDAGIRLGATVGGTTITGNLIGTNSARIALGNAIGIDVVGAGAGNTIGGSGAALANVIANNTSAGVRVSGTDASAGTATTIRGNELIQNALGVHVAGASKNLAIAGNTITRGTLDGVRIEGTASNVTVGGASVADRNFIGTTASGALGLGNARNGVSIASTGTGIRVENNAILGNGTANTANDNAGVRLSGTDAATLLTGNTITSNRGAGVLALGNARASLTRNTISSNTASGVHVASGTLVVGGDKTAADAVLRQNANTLESNGRYGVEVLAGAFAQIAGNAMNVNRIGGILNANTGTAAPVITAATRSSAVATNGLLTVAFSGLTGGDVVHVYAGSPQGRVYLGRFTATATTGTFQMTLAQQNAAGVASSISIGAPVTATRITAAGHTSPFAAARTIARVA